MFETQKKKKKKRANIVNIDDKKSWYLPNDFQKNVNEIFSKTVSYDNTKSHKKPELYFLHRKCTSGKTTGGWQLDPQSF